MGKMIDIDDFYKRYMFHAENKAEAEFNQIINELKKTEAIPKADYEARLRADMAAMLTEIQLEIADNVESIVGHYDKDTPMANRPSYKIERNDVRQECIDIIQQKINSLQEART